MGNKLGRRRQVIDEKYTRPQGLYHHKDVDHKKLKKLILESKLAPCYPGDEDCTCDLEECPICFLYYPSLNRSRCCMKGICTASLWNSYQIPLNVGLSFPKGCYKLKPRMLSADESSQFNSTDTVCPFCKTSNYAVEYRGVKTKEEKGLEQVEEQRVIEAKIRIRQQELHDDEERMQKRQELDAVSRNTESADVEYSSVNVPSSTSPEEEGDEIVSSHDSCSALMVRPSPPPLLHREDEFDLDLEDIMVIEAIWLSIQESGRNKAPNYAHAAASSGHYVTEDRYVSPSMVPVAGPSSSSPSGGLACAIAALAERQQMTGEHNADAGGHRSASSSGNISPERGMTPMRDGREWNGSEAAEAGTSYASSDAAEGGNGMTVLPPPARGEGSTRNVQGAIVPENYEEQMMLAMALSLAEARAIAGGPAVSWQ